MTKADSPFPLARAVSCASLARVKLVGSKADLFGPCPLCGGEDGSKRFHITTKSNTWHCFACGEGGGAIELAALIQRGKRADTLTFDDLLELARELANMTPKDSDERHAPPPPPKREASQPSGPSYTERMAAAIWKDARPAAGTIVESWLRARGIDPGLFPHALHNVLRFNPRALVAAGRAENGPRWEVRAPAMVAPMCELVDGAFKVRAVHCTYLTRDGSAKFELRAPDGAELASRKMWGGWRNRVCPLTPRRFDGPLLVGEGVETVFSALSHFVRAEKPARGAAVLTLENMQGQPFRDEYGRVTIPPLADMDKPPWTMPDAGDVLLLLDRDMAHITIKRRAFGQFAARVTLTDDDRADFCAALASQHWRKAGATSVRHTRPLLRGADFNDMERMQ